MTDTLDWNEYAQTWDTDAGARAYAASAWSSLQAACHLHKRSLEGARVLDFGCGTGLLTERLAPVCAEVVALDASTKMIDVLTAKVTRLKWTNVHPVMGTWASKSKEAALSLPFDAVVCSSVCAFLDDYPGTVSDMAKRLAPGGLFVQWDWALDPEDEEPFGLTTDAIADALTNAGLEVLSVDVGFTLTMNEKTMRPLMGVGRQPQAAQ